MELAGSLPLSPPTTPLRSPLYQTNNLRMTLSMKISFVLIYFYIRLTFRRAVSCGTSMDSLCPFPAGFDSTFWAGESAAARSLACT